MSNNPTENKQGQASTNDEKQRKVASGSDHTSHKIGSGHDPKEAREASEKGGGNASSTGGNGRPGGSQGDSHK